MLITRKSQFTGVERTLEINVTQQQIDLWNGGMLIQKAMPHLTDDEREFIMTGITADEWASLEIDEGEYLDDEDPF